MSDIDATPPLSNGEIIMEEEDIKQLERELPKYYGKT